MKLKRVIIENYKGINTPVSIEINDFNCIVGPNKGGYWEIIDNELK